MADEHGSERGRIASLEQALYGVQGSNGLYRKVDGIEARVIALDERQDAMKDEFNARQGRIERWVATAAITFGFGSIGICATLILTRSP